MRFSKYEKSQILSSELYHPVKSFDEKLCIYETCHKHVYKNETPSQAVCNKMALDPLPDELKDFKKLGDILISKRFFFFRKERFGKSECSKTSGDIYNIIVEAANICNILSHTAVSKG